MTAIDRSMSSTLAGYQGEERRWSLEGWAASGHCRDVDACARALWAWLILLSQDLDWKISVVGVELTVQKSREENN